MNQILLGRASAGVLLALLTHPTAWAASAAVLIEDAGFSPAAITVNQGDEVFWFNDGTEVHSAKAESGEWNSGRIQPLDYYSTFLTHTGRFAYACSQHPAATGLVTVVAAVGPPTVSIFYPGDMTRFGQPATFSFQVLAFDSDGTVSNVVFLSDSSALATNQSSPFNFTVTDLTAGNHVLTARATDNQGYIGTSAPVNITVTSPAAGTTRFVEIQAGRFMPGVLSVTAGDTVILRNLDSSNHTAAGTFTSGKALCGSAQLTATRSCTNTFTVPGAFEYFCGLHPSERGTVMVSQVTGPPLRLVSPFITGGQFQFDLTTTPGLTYVIQRATNLPPLWVSVRTNAATANLMRFVETESTWGTQRRFYRAFSPP